ncbi:unannotated protein [freshwater metagenome]|uniref:Unannotated protein n=1 Tax=freshwater metagenome TaxID=449393 RepID=A0A6J7ERU0_9ZZZZ
MRQVCGVGEQAGHDHGDRVDLLSRRAAWHPDPDLLGAIGRSQVITQVIVERLERFGVAEEGRDGDEHAVHQGDRLGGLGYEQRQIVVDVGHLQDRHAALDLPEERRFLVAREVDAGRTPQFAKNAREGIGSRQWDLVAEPIGGRIAEVTQPFADLRRVQHEIAGAECQRRIGHRLEFRRAGQLDDREAVGCFDRAHAVGAVGPGAGEDHADPVVAPVLGDRGQEAVDVWIRACGCLGRHQVDAVAAHDDVAPRRGD